MKGKSIRFNTSYIEPYPLQLVGESKYKENIAEVSGYVDEEEGIDADDFIATLHLEDDNTYDRGNAVRVDIDGMTVGYLSKADAKKYRARLVVLEIHNIIGECYASIKGGFIRRDGEQADFGVRLDLDLNSFVVNPSGISKAKRPQNEIAAPINEITPASTPDKKRVKFGGKMPLLSMKSNGFWYFLLILPFIAIINLYILLFAGIWYSFKYLYDLIISTKDE